MTDLSGVFETDLRLPDALTACVEGLDSLGWEVESVEARRILSRAGSGNGSSPTVEIELAEGDAGTDIRIEGADSEAAPLEEAQIATLLDRARDAIGDRIEQLPESPVEAEQAPEAERDSDSADVWTPVAAPDYYEDELEPTVERPAPVAEPAGPAPPSGESEARASWWDRNKRIVAIGALVFCVGGAVGAAASGSGGGDAQTVNRVKTKTAKGEVRTRTQVKTVTSTVSTVVATPPPSTSQQSEATGGTGASGAPSSSSPASPGGGCDPSYAPVCLDPNASDYDCLGSGDDGPRFVKGPVTIVGTDHYGLDSSDHDGVGCE